MLRHAVHRNNRKGTSLGNVRHLAIILGLVFIYALLTSAESTSVVAAPLPREPGIWCEVHSTLSLSKAHESRLATSLARITGFCDLHFQSDGSLTLGEITEQGGATAAREILAAALSSGMIFLVEDHSGSDSVNFGQVSLDAVCDDSGASWQIWHVRLDFKDFQQMQASADVRASFDEGFTLLHELLHGLGYEDASAYSEIGDCEDRVNAARAELGLPLRDQYFGTPLKMTEQITTVRIRFRKYELLGSASRPRSEYLYFALWSNRSSSDEIRSLARAHRYSARR